MASGDHIQVWRRKKPDDVRCPLAAKEGKVKVKIHYFINDQEDSVTFEGNSEKEIRDKIIGFFELRKLDFNDPKNWSEFIE
jgi:hypothetical protein